MPTLKINLEIHKLPIIKNHIATGLVKELVLTKIYENHYISVNNGSDTIFCTI